MSLRKREDTGTERGHTRSHFVENILWKRLWSCPKTGCTKNGIRADEKMLSGEGSNVLTE
jgi:hypothetical protein